MCVQENAHKMLYHFKIGQLLDAQPIPVVRPLI